jgi:hypothetical protein
MNCEELNSYQFSAAVALTNNVRNAEEDLKLQVFNKSDEFLKLFMVTPCFIVEID